MTEQDQDAAIGRMIAKYSTAKKRRAALMSEAATMSQQLNNIGGHLHNLEFFTAFWGGRPDGYSRNKNDLTVVPFPDTVAVTALVDDLRVVAAECRQLRQQLIDAGVSLD